MPEGMLPNESFDSLWSKIDELCKTSDGCSMDLTGTS